MTAVTLRSPLTRGTARVTRGRVAPNPAVAQPLLSLRCGRISEDQISVVSAFLVSTRARRKSVVSASASFRSSAWVVSLGEHGGHGVRGMLRGVLGDEGHNVYYVGGWRSRILACMAPGLLNVSSSIPRSR
jgi:hypothetical protein